jgi:two-component system response regulator YesN
VHEAEDGAKALAKILDSQTRGLPYDLLITDIMLPRISGLTLLKNLHMQKIVLPVLVITGYLTASIMEELHQMSYRNIMIKPFKTEELHRRVLRMTAANISETRF